MTTKRQPRTPSPKPRALPKALTESNRRRHASRAQSLAEEGFAALALVLERRRAIDASFVDIGVALATLKRAEVIDAMGAGSWERLCAKKLRMTSVHADALIDVAARVRREVAVTLGVDRASAILAIVDATPADDSVDDVLDATLALPGGGRCVVRDATTEALWSAAKALRQASAAKAGAKKRGGRTTTAEERAELAALSRRVKGIEDAKMQLVARGSTKGALVRAEFPLALAEAFAKALGRAPKG